MFTPRPPTASLLDLVADAAATFRVDPTRPCVKCEYRRVLRILGMDMRCTHPLVPSVDVLFGLPRSCGEARQPGQPCGPGGDLHSSRGGPTQVS